MNINSLAGIQLEPNHLSCTFEESCNRFLKSREGLSYLIMRYSNLSLQQAIEEYKIKALQNDY